MKARGQEHDFHDACGDTVKRKAAAKLRLQLGKGHLGHAVDAKVKLVAGPMHGRVHGAHTRLPEIDVVLRPDKKYQGKKDRPTLKIKKDTLSVESALLGLDGGCSQR
jgi:hypothetical protein